MKAVVLCAGYGTRLGALTQGTPKPMLPIHGEPLIAHTLRYLAHHGFHEVAINLHYLPEVLPNYVGDGRDFGVSVTYSHEPELRGTAGTLLELRDFLQDEPTFAVVYGDLLLDEDLGPMLAQHERTDALATLLLHERPGSNSIVDLHEDGRISSFLERPSEEERKNARGSWVNSGLALLKGALLQRMEPKFPSDLPKDVYARMTATGRIFGFPKQGFRCAIDSKARYEEACAAMAEGRCRSFRRC